MQALGAWTLTIPEFEVKLETGRHIFYHADAARFLRERLNEQEHRLADIDQHRDPDIDLVIEEILRLERSRIHRGNSSSTGSALATAYRHHIDDTDAVTDTPTIRLLRRILTDYQPMLDWAEGAVAAYIEGGIEEARLQPGAGISREFWGASVESQELTRAMRLPRNSALKLNPFNGAPSRCAICDSKRSRTQAITIPLMVRLVSPGTLMKACGSVSSERSGMRSTRLKPLALLSGTSVSKISRLNTTWLASPGMKLAIRKLAIAHSSLPGYDPFELRNRLTGSTCRGPMEPAFAMAEINLFGEVGVLKTINNLIDTARERDDSLLLHIADFIRADERTHVRKGQHILKCMTTLGAQTTRTPHPRTFYRMPRQPRRDQVRYGCLYRVTGRH